MNLRLKNIIIISSCALTNFEIKKYYQNGPKFIGVHSRDNLSKRMKDGAYVINLDEYASIGTHCIALYIEDVEITCFDSSGVEHLSKQIEKPIGDKNIKANLFNNASILLHWIH